MPVLIPSFATCREKMTAGEQRLGLLLCKHLPDDCWLWYDIPAGSKQQRRYPDFIILHPQRGLVFLEVKDWRANTLIQAAPDTCALHIAGNRQQTANPLEQARQAAFAAIDRFKSIPDLYRNQGKHQGKLAFPYGWGAVFTNITRAQMHELLQDAADAIFPEHLVLYKDDLDENIDAETFSQRIWGMRNARFACDLSAAQINHIRSTLFPEIRVPVQSAFIPKKAATQSELIRLMDVEQERVARNMGDGHRVIHGVAGSGKTLILITEFSKALIAGHQLYSGVGGKTAQPAAN